MSWKTSTATHAAASTRSRRRPRAHEVVRALPPKPDAGLLHDASAHPQRHPHVRADSRASADRQPLRTWRRRHHDAAEHSAALDPHRGRAGDLRTPDAVGIEYRQSGMDNIRNITGCPMAGLDRDEVLDASPIAARCRTQSSGARTSATCRASSTSRSAAAAMTAPLSQIHDLGLTPAIKDGRAGFNVRVGGAMGGKSPRLRLRPRRLRRRRRAPPLSAWRSSSIFRDEGSRENRLKARLKGCSKTGASSASAPSLSPLRAAGAAPAQTRSLLTPATTSACARQKQAGLHAVGCLVPVGRITGDDLIEFGRLAERLRHGELRLTNNQNCHRQRPEEKLPPCWTSRCCRTYSPQPADTGRGAPSPAPATTSATSRSSTPRPRPSIRRGAWRRYAGRPAAAHALVRLSARLRPAPDRRHRLPGPASASATKSSTRQTSSSAASLGRTRSWRRRCWRACR